ncbi:pyridoxamine 5'-phosphate oxidase family protein [Nocardia sp. BMG51109]|uniref:pyridoxamine 5'-phosphate oxidase family protein n=1 Tax=Nocardia sp. BMG51109 TaxID=1056816 RepID=UPI00056BAD4B|nr:pyridoxamine 5'-phosphate oxidase family protein [Nocardia sp. BMG51109]
MPRAVTDIGRSEALRLVAGAPFGRVVFTREALPAIRTVNHYVDGGEIIVRARVTDVVRPDLAVVVAFEADDIDPVRRVGWSVVVTGLARPVTDPGRLARYARVLRGWADPGTDGVLAIEPTLVTGIRLVERAAFDTGLAS